MCFQLMFEAPALFQAARPCICPFQELDVHSKKRKSDHRYFANHQRRRPRDLDASRDLATSKSQPSSTRRAVPSSPRREADSCRDRAARAGSDDQVRPATEQFLRVDDLDEPACDSAGDSPVYDNMAGDPARIAMARRGKLVTFYRNGDPYYKVNN